jgi:hypothetical protein
MKAPYALALIAALAVLSNSAGAERTRRLPQGYHEGRCLYVAGGKHRIVGRCFYKMDRDGSFHIDGPRQVFGGGDTVDRGASALT